MYQLIILSPNTENKLIAFTLLFQNPKKKTSRKVSKKILNKKQNKQTKVSRGKIRASFNRGAQAFIFNFINTLQ